MQLTKLHVKNLRSIRDSGEFPLKSLFSIVGENNTGKSNLLRAIEVLLSPGSGKLSCEDFNDISTPITIKGVFDNLSATEKSRWRSYLVEHTLSLEKHIALTTDERTDETKLEAEFHGYKAEPAPWYLSLQKIQSKYGERPKWADL